jgi:hypothetical protein
MPTVLVAALGISAAGATGITHQLLVYASSRTSACNAATVHST